jgi:hypothetical protein
MIFGKWGARLMGKFRDDPEFWRFQAKEARIKSGLIDAAGSKCAAQEIASQYERIASHVEERMKDVEKRAPEASILRRVMIRRQRGT